MATEEDEVRALLMRHRKQIIRDFSESKLIAILVQKGVLTATNEKLLNDIQCDTIARAKYSTATSTIIENLVNGSAVVNGSSAGDPIKNNGNDGEVNDKKCNFLIDVIARNGFEKFKEFCYAIEMECPQLIEDLINDRLKGNNGK